MLKPSEPLPLIQKPAYNADERQRLLWLALRQALIIALGGIEEYLGLERSIRPTKRRE